jgi:putative CocE/NonD family hydrolase
MNLVEVDATGRNFWLSSGRMRARHRVSTSKPVLLKPGQAYHYTLDLWHTGIRIPEGNRLRVEISSAQYPTWSRNLNTGGHNEIETKYVSATQTIFHDAKRPSHIVLPVIPPDKPATTSTVRR